jgi:hypothetical protein
VENQIPLSESERNNIIESSAVLYHMAIYQRGSLAAGKAENCSQRKYFEPSKNISEKLKET